ncbi:MAG TPA: hypothetical protein DIC36_01355 [Gammaproteobacteria bacterium]|nr:hypothetical protein [Gammaproteobacteria bacterium]
MSCGIFEHNTLALIATPATYGAEETDLNNFDALPILAGSSMSLGGDDETLDYLRGTFSQGGHTPGSAYWTVNVNTPLFGGGLNAGALVALPLDKPLRSAGFVKQDAFVVDLGAGGVTGNYALGDLVTKTVGGATVGYLAAIDDSVPTNVLALIYNATLANAPVATDGITFASGGTATASVDAYEAFVYKPTSDCSAMANACLRWYYGGVLCVGLGGRANVDFDFSAGKSAKVNFQFTTLFADPVDLAQPTDKLPPNTTPPRVVNGYLGVGGYAPTSVAQLQVQLQGDIQINDDLSAVDGYSGVDFRGRNPQGSFSHDMTLIAEHDPYDIWKLGGKALLVVRLGTVAGNRFHFVMPQAQAMRPGMKVDNKKLKYDRKYTLTGNDDELMIFYY